MEKLTYTLTTMEEAERLVAAIWVRLEERGLETPRLSVLAPVGGRLEVGVSFRNAADAHGLKIALEAFRMSETAAIIASTLSCPDRRRGHA